MAQTGYTPILIYSSSTTTNAPAVGNLTNSALGSELAINITDGKLFYKDNANVIQVIGWKTVPATAGGTGQTSYAVGDILYANTTTTLAKLADVATGNALISGGVGVAPSYGKIGLTTHISGTLAVGNGGTGQSSNLTQYGVVYGSTTTAMATTAAGTSTQVLHGNASGAPTWSAVSLTADVTGTLPVGNGGTGLTSVTANRIPYGNNTSALNTSAGLTFDGTTLQSTRNNNAIQDGWMAQIMAAVVSTGGCAGGGPSMAFTTMNIGGTINQMFAASSSGTPAGYSSITDQFGNFPIVIVNCSNQLSSGWSTSIPSFWTRIYVRSDMNGISYT